DHLRRVLTLRIEVGDLVGREFKSCRADEAALAALPLWYRPNLVSWHQGDAPALLDRTGTELIDGEELFSGTEPRQNTCDPFEFGAVLGIWAREHLSRLLEFIAEFFKILGHHAS